MATSAKKKSWAEKMEHPALPEIKILEKGFADIPAGSKMLIPTPRLIENYLKHSTPGQLTDIKRMRADLSAEMGTEYTCPLTTGIFLRIVAEYTHEQKLAGIPLKDLVPVWRIIRPGMSIWKKLSFDPVWMDQALQKEIS